MKVTIHYVSGKHEDFDVPEQTISASEMARSGVLELERDDGTTFINMENVEKIRLHK